MARDTSSKLHNKGKAKADGFSRRERQIMDALYALEQATAAQIHEALAEPPSYTAVRTLLTILEKKGHVRHFSDGPRYVYEPLVARGEMGQRAFRNLLKTFYDNSVSDAVAGMLNRDDVQVSDADLERLEKLIARARKEGR